MIPRLMLGCVIAEVLFVACGAAPLKPPCDEATAMKMAAVCAARVQTECVDKGIPEDQCAALIECDDAADKRQNECLEAK